MKNVARLKKQIELLRLNLNNAEALLTAHEGCEVPNNHSLEWMEIKGNCLTNYANSMELLKDEIVEVAVRDKAFYAETKEDLQIIESATKSKSIQQIFDEMQKEVAIC